MGTGTKEAKTEAIERARKALLSTSDWTYIETPWTDIRDGEVRAPRGRGGRVVAHVPQTEDGEAIIELRDALRALLEVT